MVYESLDANFFVGQAGLLPALCPCSILVR